MTKDTKPDASDPKSAKRKHYWVAWITLAITALGALAALVDQSTRANDAGVVRGFENRYDQKRAANINCAGKWGEERKACHALFGD